MDDKKIIEMLALMLKLYRSRSLSDIDRLVDAVLTCLDSFSPAPEDGLNVSLTESAPIPDKSESNSSGAGISYESGKSQIEKFNARYGKRS